MGAASWNRFHMGVGSAGWVGGGHKCRPSTGRSSSCVCVCVDTGAHAYLAFPGHGSLLHKRVDKKLSEHVEAFAEVYGEWAVGVAGGEGVELRSAPTTGVSRTETPGSGSARGSPRHHRNSAKGRRAPTCTGDTDHPNTTAAAQRREGRPAGLHACGGYGLPNALRQAGGNSQVTKTRKTPPSVLQRQVSSRSVRPVVVAFGVHPRS